MMATNFYWQQWRLKRRVRQTVASAEWWDLSGHWKIFAIVTFPFNLCRDVSIPTVDAELWSKVYCIMQPICSPLLLLYTFGLWNTSVGYFSAPVLCCCLGVPLSVTVSVLTHASRPPSGDTLSTIWTFAAFIMCVVWIYFFAGELVSCLEAIGILSGVPPAVLGEPYSIHSIILHPIQSFNCSSFHAFFASVAHLIAPGLICLLLYLPSSSRFDHPGLG